MRQLRLRRRVKAVYLYDLETSEAMVLYRRGRVTITDEYSLNTTLNNRSQHNMAAFYVVQLYIVNISGFKSGFCDHRLFQLLKFFVEIRNIITTIADTRSCFGKMLEIELIIQHHSIFHIIFVCLISLIYISLSLSNLL